MTPSGAETTVELLSRLSAREFFSLDQFEHRSIFESDRAFVWEPIASIQQYVTEWLGEQAEKDPARLGKISVHAHIDRPEHVFLGDNCVIEAGAYITGPVSIGSGTTIESGACIFGPAIIGRECVVRQGAYVRGQLLAGDRVVIGHASEIKNSILLNDAHAAHFNYVGDSILGNHVNLGAGTKLANLPMFSVKDPVTKKRPPIFIRVDRQSIDTGLPKLGSVLGDRTQTGCNSVLNPGCIVGRDCYIYSNVSLSPGYVSPRTIIKLRQALERGVYRSELD